MVSSNLKKKTVKNSVNWISVLFTSFASLTNIVYGKPERKATRARDLATYVLAY